MRPAAPAGPRPGVALVAIDLQNDFVHPEGLFASNGMTVPDLDGLFGATNRLVAAARRGGRPCTGSGWCGTTSATAVSSSPAAPCPRSHGRIAGDMGSGAARGARQRAR